MTIHFSTTHEYYIQTESNTFLGGTTFTQSRGAGADDDEIKGDVDEVVEGVVLTGVGTGVVGHSWDEVTTLQELLQYAT